MKICKKLSAIALCLYLATIWTSAFAQELNVSDVMELSRSVIQSQRKAIIAYNMELSEQQSEKFWPIYKEYREDMNKVIERDIKLIADYAESYINKSLTDEKAQKFIEEYLLIETGRLNVKKRYWKRFEKVLSPRQVMRFMQIENKLDAIVDAGIAKEIPLAQ